MFHFSTFFEVNRRTVYLAWAIIAPKLYDWKHKKRGHLWKQKIEASESWRRIYCQIQILTLPRLSLVEEVKQRTVKQWRGLVCRVRDGDDWMTAVIGPQEECLTPCSRQTLRSLFMFLFRYLGTGECFHPFHSLMTYGLAWYLERDRETECCSVRTMLYSLRRTKF